MWKTFVRFAYPVAFVLGVLLQIVVSPSAAFYSSALIFSLRIATYALFPFLTSSVVMSLLKILESRKMAPLLWRNVGFIVTGNFLFSLLGGIATFLYVPSKIQISLQAAGSTTPFSWEEMLSMIFPENALALVFQAQSNFLPFYIFLLLTGTTLYLTRDKVIVFREFLNSASRIFYRMNTYVVDISFVSFLFLAGIFVSNLQGLTTATSFLPLILMLFVSTLVIVFGILPLLMRYLFGITQPHKLILFFPKTFAYSFLSQDRLGSLSFLIRESRENCLVPRYLSSFHAPLYMLFFRGGNAFVTVITFVTLIKSYSSLSLELDQILALCFFVFLTSFLLIDGRGLFLLGIGWLGAYYGNNMDQAHLNLTPVIMLLGGFSALLDTLINAYFLVGISESQKLKSHYLA